MHIESLCVDRPRSPDIDRDIADHNACHAASLDLGSFSPRRQGFRVEHTDDPVNSRPCTRALEESQTVDRFLVIGIVYSRVRASRAQADQDPFNMAILDISYRVRGLFRSRNG